MPFKDEFNNVYDAIETTIKEMDGYECERADEKYTTVSIWCDRICKNILRAQYVIADTTGKNQNVFYELGFAQAIDNTNPIIITQNVKDVPFDIAPINLIEYNIKNLKELRLKIKNAIETIATDVPITTNRTPEETNAELRKQLLEEERRSKDFKDQLRESEEKEKKLKEIIKEHESIKADPEGQFINKIIELEKEIAGYKAKLKLSEQEIEYLQTLELELKAKEEKLKVYEDELKLYKQDKNIENIENILFKDNEKKLDAFNYFDLAYEEKNIDKKILLYTKAIELENKDAMAFYNRGLAFGKKGEFEKAISDYSKAIELDNKDVDAYINRGNAYQDKGEFEKAISDYNKAIELDNKDVDAYINRGNAYQDKGEFEKAISDYNKAIELDNKDAMAYLNLKELYITTHEYESALKVTYSHEFIEDEVIYYLLEYMAKVMLGMDYSQEYEKVISLLESKPKLDWSFEELEKWLSTLEESDSKQKIGALIQKVKDCGKQ
jgi:tetratricopeptide (TPR) repeat protein